MHCFLRLELLVPHHHLRCRLRLVYCAHQKAVVSVPLCTPGGVTVARIYLPRAERPPAEGAGVSPGGSSCQQMWHNIGPSQLKEVVPCCWTRSRPNRSNDCLKKDTALGRIQAHGSVAQHRVPHLPGHACERRFGEAWRTMDARKAEVRDLFLHLRALIGRKLPRLLSLRSTVGSFVTKRAMRRES